MVDEKKVNDGKEKVMPLESWRSEDMGNICISKWKGRFADQYSLRVGYYNKTVDKWSNYSLRFLSSDHILAISKLLIDVIAEEKIEPKYK